MQIAEDRPETESIHTSMTCLRSVTDADYFETVDASSDG